MDLNGILRAALPCPAKARHAEYSMVMSADDELSRPTPNLLALAIEAARFAEGIEMHEISARMREAPYYPEIWPGEHYKFLAGLVRAMNPKLVVEIGTATGLSALALKKCLRSDGRLFTFDLLPWHSISDTCLRPTDFADQRLNQLNDNLCEPSVVEKLAPTLAEAELIFVDAAKDGTCEQLIINNLRAVNFVKPPIVVFDDIRLWNMLRIWREIRAPKFDATSFGHWSGTGLVEWRW